MPFFQTELKPSIQYHGEYGITQTGIDAVVRLIQSGAWISKAILLTCDRREHFFFLELQESEQIIIRPSFTSGYTGEGPAGLAIVILMLRDYGVELEEVDVSQQIYKRAVECALKKSDIKFINEAQYVRPRRIGDYTFNVLEARGGYETLSSQYKNIAMSVNTIDSRIRHLVGTLPDMREKNVFEACKQLEQHIAKRCSSDKYGVNLIMHAFEGKNSVLIWNNLSRNESEGRVKLFLGAFSSIRNPKAHECKELTEVDATQEFLLINHLFKLEAEAVLREKSSNSD